MKKIVLYTIGALCLFGQNGIGSDHPTEAIPRSMEMEGFNEKKEKVKSWTNSLAMSQELIGVSKRLLSFTAEIGPFSWSKNAELLQLLNECNSRFAEETHCPCENVNIKLIKYPVNKDELSCYKDSVFITGKHKNKSDEEEYKYEDILDIIILQQGQAIQTIKTIKYTNE